MVRRILGAIHQPLELLENLVNRPKVQAVAIGLSNGQVLEGNASRTPGHGTPLQSLCLSQQRKLIDFVFRADVVSSLANPKGLSGGKSEN